MTEFSLKTKNVNSKVLLKEVSNFIEEIIDSFNIIWNNESQRYGVLEVIDAFFEDLKTDTNKIQQWNIICDRRNNKIEDIKNAVVRLDIYYRQRNCYNVTKLCYKITQ